MSVEEEFNVASRYRTVRKHLDSLGYKQALSLDALPLIEKLLADLIQTTESLKHFKSIAQDNIEARAQLQLTVDPYKCDNVRLVQECNQLHLDLIQAKENHQKQVKDLKKEINKLERECNNLQLTSSRNLHRIKELETESSKKSKKILELQGKCLKPIISNVGLAAKKRSCYPLRRPIIESEPLPKTSSKVHSLPNLTVEPKVVDLFKMADHKMNCLSHEVTKLKEELSIQTDNVQMLESQLTTKEKEIIRLKKMLEGGRPYSAVSKDCACKKTENNFMSNGEVDVNELMNLQQAKLDLEQQLKEALKKQHDAMAQALKLADRNEELEKELRDIDHIALAVEADCNSAVKENNERVSKLQQKLEDVMTQVHVLEGELTVERREVQELRADLEACKLEKRNIQRNLETTLDEKKRMTDRMNELTVIEKSLNDEIERLAKENERQRQDVIQLQYTNKSLKEQMRVSEILNDDEGANLKGAKKKGKKSNYMDKAQNGMDYEELRKERDVQNMNSRYDNVSKQLHEKETEISNLQHTLEQAKRERDFYKDEYNNIKDRHTKTFENDNVDLWARIRELKCQLSEKESALSELQRQKKELCCEKANLEIRLQTCKAEHRGSCRPCNTCKHGTFCKCSPPGAKDTSLAKGIIERLEHERDIARADVERLIEERDALRERLKIAAEAHTSEQRRLRENLTAVETRLKQIEKERQDLLLSQGTRRATINGLEDQLQDLRDELKRSKQELDTQRTQYFQLRALQDQTEQALGDAQNQLTRSESEFNKAMDRNRAMERQHQQLEKQVKDLQQDIMNLKANITHLDREKDQLLMVLDEKTESIAALEREVTSKEQLTMGNEHQIRELQHKNEISIDQCAEQERQIRSLQLEVENLQRQLQAATCDRENAIQENRRLQDDLAAVTCEVRNLQRELEASRAESFDLKRQLQTYVSEVRRAEELLNRKENERTEMLNHFRSLSLEATVLENNNHSLESEAAEARGALQTARDRLLDLERQLADRDSLIRSYETQISELSQNIASMETQLRQQGDQRHRTEADLTAVRDLCMKLDLQKDTLMQQLDDKETIRSQCDMQIAKLKAEQTIIQDQMTRDRATVERLEVLLDQARQESISVQANNQELQNDVSRMKQKMSELQSKLSSESAKLRQYQTQAAEYCKEITDLRRQVTNERFDRARKEEESRRQSEGFPESLTQSPTPNTNRIPNESIDAIHRYLQNERNSELDLTTDREAKIKGTVAPRYLIKDSNSKYSNSCVREFQRNTPCVNVILRSEYKAADECGQSQKEIHQSEQKPVPNFKEDSIKKDLESSSASRFDVPSNNYHVTINSRDRVNLLQPLETLYTSQYEEPAATKNNNARFDISSKNHYCDTDVLNTGQILSNEEQIKASKLANKTDLRLNLTNVIKKKEEPVAKATDDLFKLKNYESFKLSSYSQFSVMPCAKQNSDKNTEAENPSCSEAVVNICKCKNNYERHKTPLYCAEYSYNKILLRNEELKQLPIKDIPNVSTATTHAPTNYSELNTKRDNRNEEPTRTGNTSNTLQNILKGVEKLNNKIDLKYHQTSNCDENKCKNMDCSYKDVKSSNKVSQNNDTTSAMDELTKPECVKMLMEIREHTKALEEQLSFINKNMRIKRKASERQQKDTITQNPEKKNICIQNPSHEDINHIKCASNEPLKSKNHSDSKQTENKEKSFQQIDENATEKQIVPVRKETVTRVNNKDGVNHSDTQGNFYIQQRIYDKHSKFRDIVNLKQAQGLQNKHTRSASFVCNQLNFKPVATSTPRNVDLPMKEPSSNSVKGNTSFNKNLETKHSRALNEFLNNPAKGDTGSTSYDKAIIVLFLTRNTCNKYLKSKYKKFEFMNFKPKRINSCDQRLIRHQSLRRKSQISNGLKSVNNKIKIRDDTTRNNSHCFGKRSVKNQEMSKGQMSDLLTTVCTQSSDLYITSATSISYATLNSINSLKNFRKERLGKKEACIVC